MGRDAQAKGRGISSHVDLGGVFRVSGSPNPVATAVAICRQTGGLRRKPSLAPRHFGHRCSRYLGRRMADTVHARSPGHAAHRL